MQLFEELIVSVKDQTHIVLINLILTKVC